MTKTKIFALLIILIGFNSCSKKLTCSDFKQGKFKIIIDDEEANTYEIIRNGNFQSEIGINENGKLEKENIFYETIEWSDDCTYRLKIDESKMEMTSAHRLLNDNGGILTELIKIEGNCFYYKSSLTLNGETEFINGRICKE